MPGLKQNLMKRYGAVIESKTIRYVSPTFLFSKSYYVWFDCFCGIWMFRYF